MTEEEREEFIEEHTPYDDWREFLENKQAFEEGDDDGAAS